MGRILEVDLPYPVSVNRMYRAYRGRVIKSPEYRAWEKACSGIAISALAQDFDGVYAGLGSARVKVMILVWPPDKRQRDIDNIVKGILDSLEAANWIKNDSQVDILTVCRMETSRHDPRVKITMEKIDAVE